MDGHALLCAIREALATREGRAIARAIVNGLRLADDEAKADDPVASDVDEAFARARRNDRRRGSK
jgi:hypothetical protein